jgi:Mycothiol maleylpyruvate isomerase N-terminal domain
MTHDATTRALAAEAEALQAALTGLTEQESSLPSPCSPWTVGELLCHVVIGAGRIAQALAEPEPASTARTSTAMASTADYYRQDARFSAAVDTDRIETARRPLPGTARSRRGTAIRCR